METPVSTIGRCLKNQSDDNHLVRCPLRPVSDDIVIRDKIKELCEKQRHEMYGHSRIRAHLIAALNIPVSRKTVFKIMKELGLTKPRIRYKSMRPKRIEKMTPDSPNKAWQIDMTSIYLSDMTPLFLIVVIDCFTRKLVGWTLDRRCRASEWISALRLALDNQKINSEEARRSLTLRSDNGCQPTSNKYVKYLKETGINGQYTGYNAPDDNAFVERVIRTIKEEEIWLNLYDSWSDAHEAVDEYIQFYNNERIHSALNYKTPKDIETCWNSTLKAA
jgi:putative transposase